MNNLDFLKKYYNLDYFKPEYLSEEGLPKYLQQPNNEDVDWVEYLKDNKQGILGNLSKSATAFALGNNTSDAVRNIGYTGLNFIPGYGQILSTVLPVTDKLGEGMEKAIANGYKGGIGSTLSNIQSYIPGSKSNLALTAGVAGLERMFGSKINDENVNKIKNNITNTNNWNTNATTYDSLAYDVANSPMANSISQNQVGKDGSGFFGIGKPKRAKNLYNRLSTQVDLANDRLNNKIFDARAGVANNVNLNMNKNYYNNFALGGNLFENGGDLFNYGLDFSNGLQYVNAGSTHENNPYQGVPISINEQDGQPNLVEEGEVIAGGDYVFSNRLTVPDDLARRLGVPRGKTYAEAVKYLSKESEELPNDPIVKRGLQDTIAKLQESQEQLKQEQQEQEQAMQAILSGQYADGGTINIKEANKGLFTKAAKKVGMGTQEYAHHILANKDDYSTQQIRRANFARNAAGWQHANGGHVFAMGSPEVSTDWDSTTLLNLTGIDTRDEKTKMLERLDKIIKETQTKLNRQGNVKKVNFSLPKSTTIPTIRLDDAVNSMMNYDPTPVGLKSQEQRDREYGEMMNIDLPTETTHGDEEYLRNGLFAIENAARVGMKNGKITPYDKSTLGAGLDFEKNTYGKEIKNILNKRGYLTQEEHDKFLTSNISDFEKSIKSDLNKIGIRYASLPKEVKLALLQRAWQTGSASESIKLNKDALQSKDYDTVIRYMTEGNGMKNKAEAINRGGRLSDYLHNNGYVSDAEYAARQNAFAYANRPKTNEEIVSELGRNFVLGLDNSPEALQAATNPNYADKINEYKVLNDYEKNLNDNTNNTTTPTQKTTSRSTQQTQPTNEDETIIDWEAAYDNNEFALGGHMYDGNSETSQYIPVSQLGDWQRTDVANFDWKNASSLPEGFDWDWQRGLLNRFNNWQPYTHTEKWNKTGYDGIYPKGSDEEKTLRADPRYNFFNGYDDNLTRYGKMYNLFNKNNKKIKQIDFSQPLDKQIEYIKHLRYDDSVGSGSQEIGLRQNRYYTQDQNGNRRYVNVPDPTLYNVAEKYTDRTIDPNNPSVAYYNYLIKDIPQNNIIQDNTATTTTPTQQQQEETPKVKRKYLPYLDDSLRYVPLGINAASLLYNTRPVDFTAADRYRNYAEQIGTPISSPLATIGNYRRRNPYDESYTANMINQTTAANNRQSYDIAGGNRAMQMGSQSARDYTNLQQLSQNALAAYQANRTDDAQVADFNRATDETNVKYENARNQYLSQLNNARDLQSKQALINEAIYRQNLRDQRDIAIANDISRLSENLSGLGEETRHENILRWLYNNGVLAPTHDILTKTERTTRRKDRKKSTEKRKVKQNKKTKLEDIFNMSYPLVDITPEILKYK